MAIASSLKTRVCSLSGKFMLASCLTLLGVLFYILCLFIGLIDFHLFLSSAAV